MVVHIHHSRNLHIWHIPTIYHRCNSRWCILLVDLKVRPAGWVVVVLVVVVLAEGDLMAVALAEMDLVVVALRTAPAWFLVERDPWMAPYWLLNSYLEVEGLVLVLVALCLAEWGLDLGLAPCPGFGLIDA